MLKSTWIKNKTKFVPQKSFYYNKQIFEVWKLKDNNWEFDTRITEKANRKYVQNKYNELKETLSYQEAHN